MVDANRRRLTVGRADPSAAHGGKDESGSAGLAEYLEAKFPQVTCIHSTTDSELKKKRSFAEKSRANWIKGALKEAKDSSDNATIPNMDFTCKKGLKPESPNQDSFIVVITEKFSLYGVFDGHGPFGHFVSDFALKALLTKFFERPDYASDTGAAFKSAFVECQKVIEAKKEIDSSSSGSTCTMAFHNLETDVLTLGHVGDSRAVLFAGPVPGKILHESEDHKPNLPKEKERIEKNGGRVVFDGYYNHRVFAKAGQYPGLNMSRALGDVVAHKEAGLTAEPELFVINLKEKREAYPGQQLSLLVCSDGVWEFIKSEDALKVLQEKEGPVDPDGLKVGVEKLAKKSWDSWMADSENEISDDITVLATIL